jgi:hypothetical protein
VTVCSAQKVLHPTVIGDAPIFVGMLHARREISGLTPALVWQAHHCGLVLLLRHEALALIIAQLELWRRPRRRPPSPLHLTSANGCRSARVPIQRSAIECNHHPENAMRRHGATCAVPVGPGDDCREEEEKLLRQTRTELAAGKKLIAEKKRLAKESKRKRRKNAKRQAELIERTVDAIEDHRELLVEQVKATKRKTQRRTKSTVRSSRQRN